MIRNTCGFENKCFAPCSVITNPIFFSLFSGLTTALSQNFPVNSVFTKWLLLDGEKMQDQGLTLCCDYV